MADENATFARMLTEPAAREAFSAFLHPLASSLVHLFQELIHLFFKFIHAGNFKFKRHLQILFDDQLDDFPTFAWVGKGHDVKSPVADPAPDFGLVCGKCSPQGRVVA